MSHPLVTLSDRALKILVILLLAGEQVSRDYIRAEYKLPVGEKGLTDALKELTHERLITRVAYRGEAWLATPLARQLILGETSPRETSSEAHPINNVALTPYPQIEATYPQAGQAQPAKLLPQSFQVSLGETSTHLASFLDLDNLDPEDDINQLASYTLETSPRETSPLDETDSTETSLGETDPHLDPKLYDPASVLTEYGIDEPKRSQLIALWWVTADYIDAHCSRALAAAQQPNSPIANNPLGAAIHRITKHWIPGKPDENYLTDNGRLRHQQAREQADLNSRRRYLA